LSRRTDAKRTEITTALCTGPRPAKEVPWLAADFPYSLVFLVPPARGRVRRGGEELLGDRVELTQLVGQPLRGTEQLTVYVKLALGPRPVADPHRTASPPAGQVRQLPFGKVVLAADPEHDLQVLALP
jgi:hypothetical protein